MSLQFLLKVLPEVSYCAPSDAGVLAEKYYEMPGSSGGEYVPDEYHHRWVRQLAALQPHTSCIFHLLC